MPSAAHTTSTMSTRCALRGGGGGCGAHSRKVARARAAPSDAQPPPSPQADLEAELAAMEDDPSLFFSAEADSTSAGAADYLDLPATSTEPVAAGAEVPSDVPAAETQTAS